RCSPDEPISVSASSSDLLNLNKGPLYAERSFRKPTANCTPVTLSSGTPDALEKLLCKTGLQVKLNGELLAAAVSVTLEPGHTVVALAARETEKGVTSTLA